MHLDVKESHQHDRYSVTEITLRYIFTLSHNASTLEKSYRFYIYRSRLLETVIASYNYLSRLIGNFTAFFIYVSGNMTNAITCNAVTF
jgi:hypothetical protein